MYVYSLSCGPSRWLEVWSLQGVRGLSGGGSGQRLGIGFLARSRGVAARRPRSGLLRCLWEPDGEAAARGSDLDLAVRVRPP